MNKKKILIITFSIYIVVALANFFILSSAAFVYAIENFLLLITLLFVIVAEPAKIFFEERAQSIKNKIGTAQKNHDAARATLTNIKKKLSTVDKEAKILLDKVQSSASKERDALVAEGKKMSQKTLEDAKTLAGHERIKTKVELRKYAANLAAHLAENKITQRITDQDQERLGQEFVNLIKKVS